MRCSAGRSAWWHATRVLWVVIPVSVSVGGCGDGSTEPEPVEDDVVSIEGLVAHYSLGGDATDGSGAGNHGAVVGSYQDGALVLGNNDTDHLSVPASVLDGAQDFSLGVWVRIDELRESDHHVLMNASAPGEPYGFLVSYRAFTESWFTQWAGGSRAFDRDATVEDGAWHHLTYVREGEIARAYLDGIEISAELVSGTALEVETGGLVFGQAPDAVAGGFDPALAWAGALDELRIYRRALTAEEATLLSSAGR